MRRCVNAVMRKSVRIVWNGKIVEFVRSVYWVNGLLSLLGLLGDDNLANYLATLLKSRIYPSDSPS
jgi:hypothetical protein